MEYFVPNFLDEALVVLDRFGPSAKVLAGGTILGTRLRRARDAAAIVNVKRIPALSIVERVGDVLRIGAMVTAGSLADNRLVLEHTPVVAMAAASLGARQLRSVATIGGNVLSGHHSADLSVALLVSDATVVYATLRDGRCELPIERLLSPGFAGLETGALVTAIEAPICGGRAAFQKMQTRRAFEMAVVSVAAVIRFEGDVVMEARLALGGAAPSPIRAVAAEAVLFGQRLNAVTADEAARVAAEVDAEPRDDDRASAEYRRHLARVLTGRALASIIASGKAGNP